MKKLPSRKHAYIILTPPAPRTPTSNHFYIVKLGFTGYTLFLLKYIDCRYSLEPPRQGGSNEYPQSMFWAEIWKISEFFIWKFSFFFCGKIFSIFEYACFRNDSWLCKMCLGKFLIRLYECAGWFNLRCVHISEGTFLTLRLVRFYSKQAEHITCNPCECASWLIFFVQVCGIFKFYNLSTDK